LCFRQLRQRTGRPADQDRERVAGSTQRAFEFRDGALCAEILRFRLLQIEFGAVAALEQALGDFQSTNEMSRFN
jgi:hypothetical protein